MCCRPMLRGRRFLTELIPRTFYLLPADMERARETWIWTTMVTGRTLMIESALNLKPIVFAILAIGAAIVFAGCPNNASGQIAVRGETVHTMAGAPIPDGVVLIRDGKIERVGPASQVIIPDGYKVLNAKVVTPGLIDAHTVVGLSGYLNQTQEQDQLEGSTPIQPELRAIDAYNAQERLVEWLRGFGITTVHTGHGPGALVSGQTMIVKTTGDDSPASLISAEAMIAVTLGADGLGKAGKSPGTRSKAVAMLRADLQRAVEYDTKM